MFKKNCSKKCDRTQQNNETKSFSSICLLDANNGKIHTLSNKQRIKNIIAGYNGTTYIIMEDNSFMVYGYNAHGQLGLNHFDYVPEVICYKQFKIKNVFSSISSKHSFCITQKNTIYAVGNNLNNQFGIQTKTANTLNKWIKINPFESNINIQIKSISTSWEYTIFLTENGQIYQTNNGNTNPIKSNKYIQLIEMKDKNIKFRDIKCGKYHSFAICENNNLYAWGDNHYGQLGLINTRNMVQIPQKLMYFVENEIQIKKVACGLYHSLILDSNSKVHCFGSNNDYQLGNGMNCSYLRTPQMNKTLKYEMIMDIKCGAYHNLVRNDRNEYLLWGNNKDNQCLVYNEDNNDNYEYYEKNNIDFITIPRKYKYNKNGMEIIDIYIGYKTTLVLSRKLCGNKGRDETFVSKRKNKLIMQLRGWCDSFIPNLNRNKKVYDINLTGNELNGKNMNQLNEFDRVDEEKKYEEEDINDAYETRSKREYGEYYCIPTKQSKLNPWNKTKNADYYPVSLNEC